MGKQNNLKSHLKITIIYAAIFLTSNSCTTKTEINKSLLAGYWLTTQPEITPNIILDSVKNYSMLIEGPTVQDTLHFTYQVNDSVITIFSSPAMPISKMLIIKLSKDSLVCKREDNNAIFHYSKSK
jgi:hypothetical protein